jgi:hypothetical protein
VVAVVVAALVVAVALEPVAAVRPLASVPCGEPLPTPTDQFYSPGRAGSFRVGHSMFIGRSEVD